MRSGGRACEPPVRAPIPRRPAPAVHKTPTPDARPDTSGPPVAERNSAALRSSTPFPAESLRPPREAVSSEFDASHTTNFEDTASRRGRSDSAGNGIEDPTSTRLNYSHVSITHAVFFLK